MKRRRVKGVTGGISAENSSDASGVPDDVEGESMDAATFFNMSHASSDTKGVAWAGGFGPLPNSMPFLNEAECDVMNRFWKVNPMKPGLVIDPGGREWPDFLGHGRRGAKFFISERVFHALQGDIRRATEMPIAEVNAKALRAKPAPRYFVAETHPGIKVDFVASGIPIDRGGSPNFKAIAQAMAAENQGVRFQLGWKQPL